MREKNVNITSQRTVSSVHSKLKNKKEREREMKFLEFREKLGRTGRTENA